MIHKTGDAELFNRETHHGHSLNDVVSHQLVNWREIAWIVHHYSMLLILIFDLVLVQNVFVELRGYMDAV